jgi:CubicO group peptidase (beta-lactamase class C family)
MSSGLDYQEFRPLLLNSDDPLTTYHPDQRRIALTNTHIVQPPGEVFSYNKYHPQLLGLILERTTGLSVTTYLQTRLWDPLGMEYGGSWSLDSAASGFEKMETGVNARAIDFARFGVLFLNGGRWEGRQVLSPEWVAASTEPYFPADRPGYYPEFFASRPGRAYYQLMWWGTARDSGGYDFAAAGDKGQYIYVVPHQQLVIVRHGTDFGLTTAEWMRLFYEFGAQYAPPAGL